MLHLSAEHCHLEVVKFCIEDLRFPVIVQNKKGQVPLDIARKNQEYAKSIENTEKTQKIIEYL